VLSSESQVNKVVYTTEAIQVGTPATAQGAGLLINKRLQQPLTIRTKLDWIVDNSHAEPRVALTCRCGCVPVHSALN